MSILEVTGLSKPYGDGLDRTDVLDDINLKVDDGEFTRLWAFPVRAKLP